MRIKGSRARRGPGRVGLRLLLLNIIAIASASAMSSAAPHATSLASPIRIGLILDRGGKNDNSFNSAAYKGAMDAKRELGVYVKYVEAPDIMSFESMQRALAKKHFNLIIAIGFSQIDALKHVAKEFPNVHFAIVDGQVDLPNVKSILFEEHEGSYLVGALAARKSKTHTVGFIGGMDIPLIRRFQMGYVAGVHKFSPQTKVLSEYIGITAEAWNNPSKAKEIALTLYNEGADIIFVAAGASGTGVFDAAEETHHFAIGVDSDQNWMKPGFILTSLVKRVDKAVFSSIQEEEQNTFKGGVQWWGLKDGGIDYAVDQYNKSLIDPATLHYLEQLKHDIISGKIVVPDYYKITAAKAHGSNHS